MTKLVVDSTFYLEKEFCNTHDIRVVPLVLRLNGQEYPEGFPSEHKEVFEQITASKAFPQTACPSPEDYKKVFEEILMSGDEVLCLCLSSGLSAAYHSAALAAAQTGGDKVTVCDTRIALAPMSFAAKTAVRLLGEGCTREETAAALSEIVPRAQYACLPLNLDYIIKGGRLKGLAAIIGKLARIKPIVSFKNGALCSAKKVFTMSAGDSYMLDMIGREQHNIARLYFGYVYDSKYMLPFREKVLASFPDLEPLSENFEIGPVIGAHLGPFAYGAMLVTKN